jgi:hypothetical protein
MIWLLPPPLSKLSIFLKSSCVSPVELTDGRVGRGRGGSQILRRRESLLLYIPLTTGTLWYTGTRLLDLLLEEVAESVEDMQDFSSS